MCWELEAGNQTQLVSLGSKNMVVTSIWTLIRPFKLSLKKHQQIYAKDTKLFMLLTCCRFYYGVIYGKVKYKGLKTGSLGPTFT